MSVESLIEAVKIAARARQQAGADDATPTIGEALERKRNELGLTIAEFSVVVGIPNGHYAAVVKGEKPLSLNSARRAYALGIEAKVILG